MATDMGHKLWRQHSHDATTGFRQNELLLGHALLEAEIMIKQ